jgi:hypothetical protein
MVMASKYRIRGNGNGYGQGGIAGVRLFGDKTVPTHAATRKFLWRLTGLTARNIIGIGTSFTTRLRRP